MSAYSILIDSYKTELKDLYIVREFLKNGIYPKTLINKEIKYGKPFIRFHSGLGLFPESNSIEDILKVVNERINKCEGIIENYEKKDNAKENFSLEVKKCLEKLVNEGKKINLDNNDIHDIIEKITNRYFKEEIWE